MGPLSCLVDSDCILVADTSVTINLNATGFAKTVLTALKKRIIVVDIAAEELDASRSKTRSDANLLSELAASGLVEIATMGSAGLAHFESLVIGSANETLDDGEAATIAHALDIGALALIDERKAIRICTDRFPSLRLGCTIDVLAHDSVQSALGSDLPSAIQSALQNARMRVLPHHLDWVVKVIGPDQAQHCVSLPAIARRSLSNATNSK